jgi:alpha-ketoglutarate-dependent 2,4-dichlorophenoxyacetate dioxygenase
MEAAMTITAQPLTSSFAAEIIGADLSQPIDAATVDAIWSAIDRYAVVVFRDQRLTDAQLRDFAAGFGPLEIGRSAARPGRRRLAIPQIGDISNLDVDNNVRALDDRRRLDSLGNRLWHTDASYMPVPVVLGMLHAVALPPPSPFGNGETEFADMRAAYDALDARTKAEVEDLVCLHSLLFSREAIGFTEMTVEEKAAFQPVRQPLVRRHPVTRRQSLFLSAHAGAIERQTIPEARMFLRDLTEFATQPRFVYSHEWRPFDLVVWDNRQTMHRARRFDRNEVRDVRRTTLAGDGIFVGLASN